MRKRLRYSVTKLHRMWASGMSYADIAAALGCSTSTVHDLKMRHRLPHRKKPTKEAMSPDPTPEEIAARAAECRKKREAPPGVPYRPGIREYSYSRGLFVGIS